VILDAAWQMDDLAIQTLQAFEHRAVVLPKQSLRDMQAIVRIDAD
jgi:hypothetical protein